tara:strand:+ start:188 stop:529 length:342 start_codon:yes stop_codon:yes gene_type:complete
MAGCGGCQAEIPAKKMSKSSSFISNIPFNGNLEGFVVASCNKCNFGKKTDKRCSMGIKVGDKVLRINDENHDHKAAHAPDGMCNSLRVAYVEGQVMMNYLDAKRFELVEAPIK